VFCADVAKNVLYPIRPLASPLFRSASATNLYGEKCGLRSFDPFGACGIWQ